MNLHEAQDIKVDNKNSQSNGTELSVAMHLLQLTACMQVL